MMFRKPKKNAQFEDEYVSVMPKRGELVFVKDRNSQYIRHCRNDVMDRAQNNKYRDTTKGFLDCKPLIDSTFECYTKGLYGSKIEDAPEPLKIAAKGFFQCAFKGVHSLDYCHEMFTDIARAAYRIDPTLY